MSDGLRARRVVAGVLAWLLFAAAWAWVLGRPGNGVDRAALVLPGAVLLTLGITVVWQRHNRAIYRRKGPRRGVPATERRWSHDTLGRPLEFHGDPAAAEVVLEQDWRGVKIYRGVR